MEYTIVDEYGEDKDWIEIYNGENKAINLNGMFLTDDLTRPQRWKLPDMTLKAGEFLLIWADGDTNTGLLHTNFRLDRNGEGIGLFENDILGNHP